MSDDIKKSNYGPKGAGLYNPVDNAKRKANNVGDVAGDGPNHNVKSYSSKPGQLSAKAQAEQMHTKRQNKKLSGPIKTYTKEEVAALGNNPTAIRKDEMLDIAPDGKREIVEGKEPLKKDPKNRWKSLKKALDHDEAFMSMDEELADPEPAEQPKGDQPQDDQQPLEAVSTGGEDEQDPTQDSEEEPQDSEEAEAPPEETDEEGGEEPSEGEEGDPEEGNGDISPDQQELIDALKEEGHSDQEIAYIVHGHHAPEVDPSKQAKAQSTQAMGEVERDSATQMAEIERQHALASMEHERSHKQRMSDLEYGDAQKQKGATDMDHAHKQRMLDLEYEKAKRESSTNENEGEGETKREMQKLEVEKKRLELKLREQEMKLELEFKQKEHELKLKMMEQQIKEQGKQKSEIGGIKHQQKLAEAKKPPAKKPLKKSEEDDE